MDDAWKCCTFVLYLHLQKMYQANVKTGLQRICCLLLFACGALLTSDGFLFLEPLPGHKGGRLSRNFDGENIEPQFWRRKYWAFYWGFSQKECCPEFVLTSRAAEAKRWWKRWRDKEKYIAALFALPLKVTSSNTHSNTHSNTNTKYK